MLKVKRGEIHLAFSLYRFKILCITQQNLSKGVNVNPVRRKVILLSFFHDLTEHPKPVCSAFRNTGVVRQQRYYLPLGIFRQNWEQLIHFVPFTGHRIENAGTATVFPGLRHRTDGTVDFFTNNNHRYCLLFL